jgi:hypothetical protein
MDIERLDRRPVAPGTRLWSKRIRTGVPLHEAAYAAAIDGADGVVITGRFGAELDLTELGGTILRPSSDRRVPRGAGPAFAFKVDASGGLVWAHHMVGLDELPPWSVAADRAGNASSREARRRAPTS